MESYITELSFSAWQTTSKLRLSDHSLEIERGRYQRPYLKPEERNCPFCPDKIEDEYHFLIECAMHRDERQAFINSIIHKSYSYINQNKLFSCIFKCHEAHITKFRLPARGHYPVAFSPASSCRWCGLWTLRWGCFLPVVCGAL